MPGVKVNHLVYGESVPDISIQPHAWTLPVYAFDEDGKRRLRLLQSQVGRDPHVAIHSWESVATDPNKYWLRMTFVEGVERPYQNALKYLDKVLKEINPTLPTPFKGKLLPMTRYQRLLLASEDDFDLDGV